MNKHLIVYIVLTLIILYLLNRVLVKKTNTSGSAPAKGTWTVYGTTGCGWTRKQLAVMDEKKIPYTFVNCDNEDCKGASAFPTLVDPSGHKTVGFSSTLG